jgi:Domain of Unknown Function (DUF349)
MTTKDPKDSVHDEQFDGEAKAVESTEETVNEMAASDPPDNEVVADHEDSEPEAVISAEKHVKTKEASLAEEVVPGAVPAGEYVPADEPETDDVTVTTEMPETGEQKVTAEEPVTDEEPVTAREPVTDEEPVAADGTASSKAEAAEADIEVEETAEKAVSEEAVVSAEKETTDTDPVEEESLEAGSEDEASHDTDSADKASPEAEQEEEESRDTDSADKASPEAEQEEEESRDTDSADKTSPEAEQEEEHVNYDDIDLPPVDYSGFSRKELLETLTLIVENRPPSEIFDDVNRIKELFYKKTKTEFNEKRLNFAKEGGNIDEYRPEPDELENSIKIILETYRVKKTDYNRVQDSEKQENLRKKLNIIDQIKELVNREEAINKTFQEFRNLQNEWHSTGLVPQVALKDLWENYHHSVEMFYDYIKINRELRDLDLKKNLESKIVLCEKAEELLLEPNAVTAFKLLQDYHNNWREIGPVPHETKNDVWERFREATSKVNKRHHEFFEKQKDEQKHNFDAKTALCEKAEEIASGEILTFADFKEKSEAIIECQKLWRTIGFAPKKHNNKIYQRFRTACDTFFEKKRAFFAESKEIQVRNLQLKTELCMNAEALQDSTDWKDTSEMLIRLQKEWKEIGPVPKKYSEKIWKRFRLACDTFFTHKSEYFQGRDTSYEDNLNAKLAILQEIETFDPGDDPKAAFERLKDIQKHWTEIGYVPFNRKEEIARRYKESLNKQFDKLKLDDTDKNILRYRSKVDSALSNPRAARKVRNEREKFFSKIKQLESDIVLWENNIGFFAKSANADTMIKEVREKIEDARRNIKLLEEKVKLIDSSMYEE